MSEENTPRHAKPDREAEPSGGTGVSSSDGSGRSWAGRWKSLPLRSKLLISVLVGLVGFMLMVQVRSHQEDLGLATARQEDLVRILADLDAQQERLRDEVASLEETERQLTSGAQGREAALEEARRRADELGILAGTLPAEGPGLEIVFHGTAARPIEAAVILNAVEELRGAGAEAMQIAGGDQQAVRIVAATYFLDGADGTLVVDGQRLDNPYTLTVIGDPQTMRAALGIPGGVIEEVERYGGTVVVHEPDVVSVSALRTVSEPEYARPTS